MHPFKALLKFDIFISICSFNLQSELSFIKEICSKKYRSFILDKIFKNMGSPRKIDREQLTNYFCSAKNSILKVFDSNVYN